MVGGLITATILSIFVLPAIYMVVEQRVQRRKARAAEIAAAEAAADSGSL